MTQINAILLDAYRELNARRLFWITLIISGLVVGAFALIGINENGIRLIVWDVRAFGLTSDIMPPDMFYKTMFLNLGVGVWLTWAAAILALISTASIFPDFITGGSIDLALSKPIGRWRLFFLKYLSGLLFVALQVGVFSVAAFLVIGLRGGSWEPSVFLAIPIIVAFFSYLFCVCVLLGLLTRSTIAALILTILFWFVIYIVHSAETTLLMFHNMTETDVKQIERSIATQEQMLATIKETAEQNRDREITLEGDEASQMEPGQRVLNDGIQGVQDDLDARKAELEGTQTTLNRLGVWHGITMKVKTVLPKTTETINLLDRMLIDLDEVQDVQQRSQQAQQERRGQNEEAQQFEQAGMGVAQELNERSLRWVLGTSLLFEAVVLLFAGWIFSRRDF